MFPTSVMGTVVNKRAQYKYLRLVQDTEKLTYRCVLAVVDAPEWWMNLAHNHQLMPALYNDFDAGMGTTAQMHQQLFVQAPQCNTHVTISGLAALPLCQCLWWLPVRLQCLCPSLDPPYQSQQ